MKIYFAGSIRGGRDDRMLYHHIITYLQQFGSVLTEHVGLVDLGEDGMSDQDIWNTDMQWLDECDVVVAEITQSSIGVGYEIGRAELLGKKIIPLYHVAGERKISAMISGNPHIVTYYYHTIDDVKNILSKVMNTLSTTSTT